MTLDEDLELLDVALGRLDSFRYRDRDLGPEYQALGRVKEVCALHKRAIAGRPDVDGSVPDHEAANRALSSIVRWDGVELDDYTLPTLNTLREYIADAREQDEAWRMLNVLRQEIARLHLEHRGQQARAWREGYLKGYDQISGLPYGPDERIEGNPYEAP